MSEAVLVPLSQIVPDPQFQPRGGGLSASHLQMLAESDPETWTPLTVSPTADGRYSLIDGFHRFEIATRRKLEALPCIVLEGAGYPEAVFANIAHGLPLSRADRKEAARWWANEEPGLSYREISRRVGISDKTVKQAIGAGNKDAPQRRKPIDPLDSWLQKTAQLDHLPNAREVAREIAEYAAADRPQVAKVYAAVGQALVDAAAPYAERR